MERKLRVALLGGGGILAAHAPGFNRLPELCEVVAVAEPRESRHNEIRELLQKDVLIVRDYTDAIALPDIDAVDILLPHDLHMDAAVRAAGRGMHVMVEKVMARNMHECQAMIDACEKAGVILVVTHDRRYAGDWVALKNIVDSGDLGEILFIKMEHNQDVNPSEGSWIKTVDGMGGGCIMSCLCHQIDALRWYFGEVEKVSCMHRILPERIEGECIGAINLMMKSGALAHLNINWYTQCHNWSGSLKNGLPYEFIHVTGTLGEAYYTHRKGTFFKKNSRYSVDANIGEYGDNAGINSAGDFVKVESDQSITGHAKCVEEFVKAARREPARVLTYGKDTIKTIEVAEAAYIAEATDAVVTLPIRPVPWGQRIYLK
jgi:predicted dehydrogenase